MMVQNRLANLIPLFSICFDPIYLLIIGSLDMISASPFRQRLPKACVKFGAKARKIASASATALYNFAAVQLDMIILTISDVVTSFSCRVDAHWLQDSVTSSKFT
jgi:hypothetical protein